MLKLFIFLIVASYNLDIVFSAGLIEVFQWKQIDFFNRGNNAPLSANLMSSNPEIENPKKDFIFPDQLQRKPGYRVRNKRNNNEKTSRDDPVTTESRFSFISNGDNNNRNTNTSSYIPYNNVPMGVTHYRGRLFITMPRRRIGIPSTLNYIDLRKDGNQQSPKLRAYPDFDTNYLNTNLESHPNRIVSVYRTSVDACQRLWFIDTGMLEYPNNRMQIQRPAIWIIDLQTDRRIRRFEIPESIVSTGRGLASITVDTKSNKCGNAFAYIPDLVNRLLFVYSFKENRMWTFSHNYFSFDPLAGDLRIGGQSFRWDDGIFSITIGHPIGNNYHEVYFHPMASNNEFVVSNQILQNETKSQLSDYDNDFELVGSRGERRQSTMHSYDASTGVIFYAEIQRNGVGCWNTNKRFSPRNHGTVDADEERMIYPSDLTIDDENNIWVMTNSMPIFIYSNLNPDEVNFRVWRQNVNTAIKNTVCA